MSIVQWSWSWYVKIIPYPGGSKSQRFRSALVSLRIRPEFYLNADPDPRSQTNADPDPNAGQVLLSHSKLNFFIFAVLSAASRF
jgi:hypothetical protein